MNSKKSKNSIHLYDIRNRLKILCQSSSNAKKVSTDRAQRETYYYCSHASRSRFFPGISWPYILPRLYSSSWEWCWVFSHWTHSCVHHRRPSDPVPNWATCHWRNSRFASSPRVRTLRRMLVYSVRTLRARPFKFTMKKKTLTSLCRRHYDGRSVRVWMSF